MTQLNYEMLRDRPELIDELIARARRERAEAIAGFFRRIMQWVRAPHGTARDTEAPHRLRRRSMTIELVEGAVRLARGQSLKVRDGAGSNVCARGGALWITEEGSLRDVVVEPGQCYRLRQPGLAIVHAFADASVALGRGV